MKIERKKESAFEPITITLESEEEAAAIRAIFEHPRTITKAITEASVGLDNDKLFNVADFDNMSKELEDLGISWDVMRKHLGR